MIKPSELNDDTLIRAMDVLTVIKHHANSLEKESYLCDESRKAQCINLRVMEARVVLDVVWDGILEYGFNRKPAQEDK